MQKQIFCVICLVLILGGQAFAIETTLPDELIRASPEAAELLDMDDTTGYGLIHGAVTLFQSAFADAKQYLFAGVRAVAAIMAGVVLLGMVESLTPDSTVTSHTTIIGALWITAMSAGDMNTLIGLGQGTITKISEFSKLLLPVIGAATAAGGGVTSASVRQIGTVFFSDILMTIMERLLLPMLHIYIGISAAGAVLEDGAFEKIGGLLKKSITGILSVFLILFTTYLTISGAIAGSTDAQAVRIAKTTVSTVVPVVGGILSEAAESILAGAGLLKGMVGVFGTFAILAMCLVPFLRLGAQYLLYHAASLVAQMVGPPKLTKLLSMLGDAFALVLAMTGAAALLLLISLVSTLTAVVV